MTSKSRPGTARSRPGTAHGSNGGGQQQSNGQDAEVNVQVILRCRPRSSQEKAQRMPQVIKCREATREVGGAAAFFVALAAAAGAGTLRRFRTF